MITPSLKVIVAVTSPVAFEDFNGSTLFKASFSTAKAFTIETSIDTHLTVAITEGLEHKLPDLPYEIMLCDPLNPVSFASAIEKSRKCDLVAIHDAQRPLTRTNQFHQVLEALVGNLDAVRPAASFTDTLKVVGLDQIIEKTVKRKSVLQISTPEIFRFEAIDFQARASTWFVPLVDIARTATVEAEPESFRVNSLSEIALMESFVHWQKSIAH